MSGAQAAIPTEPHPLRHRRVGAPVGTSAVSGGHHLRGEEATPHRLPTRAVWNADSVQTPSPCLEAKVLYMCSMKTVTWTSGAYLPSGVPAAYRWATNVVVYALTHGNISDYRDYVPEDLLADEEASDKAPTSARISTTPFSTPE
jgi:hypothetical protein